MDLQFAIFSYFSHEKIVPSNGQQGKAYLWTLRHIILSVHTQPKIVVLQNQLKKPNFGLVSLSVRFQLINPSKI